MKKEKLQSKGKKERNRKMSGIKKIKISKKQKYFRERKTKLAVKNRQTKWAPVWAVLRKFGMGKRIHPSRITKQRRSWRRTKLHIKPRKQRKSHFG